MNKRTLGFTIVELVTVLVILGIISATVLPKFFGSDNFEAHPFRAQLISALRLTQQRAMQQTDGGDNYCHQVVINNDRYGVLNRVSANCSTETDLTTLSPDQTGKIVESRYDITFVLVGSANPSVIGFDSMGRPTQDCSSGCEIQVSQTEVSESLKIRIESEGYIHAI